jgi:hypothetical protein
MMSDPQEMTRDDNPTRGWWVIAIAAGLILANVTDRQWLLIAAWIIAGIGVMGAVADFSGRRQK